LSVTVWEKDVFVRDVLSGMVIFLGFAEKLEKEEVL